MFNSTHTLVGLTLARAGFQRFVPHAAWTAAIAANLPDIDIVAGLIDSTAYIEYHRGITHTLVGVPILALLLAAVMHLICSNFRRHFLVALLAGATHPLLDFANTYGIRPFLPLDQTWYYGDTLFIIDPYLDVLLITGLIAAASSTAARQALVARIALLVVAVYIGIRIELRDIARIRLAEFVMQVSNHEKSAVIPSMLTPHVFAGIVQTRNETFVVELNIFDGVAAEILRMRPAPPSEILAQAELSRAGTVFRGFARFPVAEIEDTGEGYRVMFYDIRYYPGFAGRIVLDDMLQVVDETVGFNQQLD
jgi:inner membrane protein